MSAVGYDAFVKALEKSWGADTAYRKDAKYWTPDNPACGQCAITALLFEELYGGSIYGGVSDDKIYHYWNEKDGAKLDFTESQFSRSVEFQNIRKRTRNSLLSAGDVKKRYEILKERVIAVM